MNPAPAALARISLLVLLGASLVVVLMIARPFASALFMAAVLAAAFYPWFEGLSARMRGHRTLAAFLITTGLLLALVLPTVTLGVTLIRESTNALDSLHELLAREGVEGLIHRAPEPIQARLNQAWLALPSRERNTEFVFNLERRAATAIPQVVGAAGQIVIQTTLMVIALFFMLLDGGRIIAWINLVSPLQRKQIRELLTEFRRVSASVLLGTVVTAGAQAIAALIGYLIAHAPNPYVLGLVTFFIALVPILGAGGFSFCVGAYLFVIGHVYGAIFLTIWSMLVVGLVDNIVKPLVIKGGIEMHGAVVFFALIGGFAVFGPIGLVLGPLSVTFLLSILRIYQRDFGAGQSAA